MLERNSPCPYCGRPMKRDVLARLENPFCAACHYERLEASGAKRRVNPMFIVDEDGYAEVRDAL